MKELAPSLLSADFARLGEQAELVSKHGADYLHIDVMDGHFVPNITLSPFFVEQLRKITQLPLDVHLMVENPGDYVEEYAKIGVEYFTFHWEAVPHAHRLIQAIKATGMKAGVSLNPSTPVSLLEDIAEDLDLILVMSVNPGFGGQSFIHNAVKKVKQARELLDSVGNTKAVVEVDGGINLETAPLVREAGATLLVAGSAVFGSEDRAMMIAKLRG